MSTNSTISIQLMDGTIKTCYCHWDGSPASNGVILLAEYQNPEKIKQLISLGDLSVLKANIEPTGKHSFDKPEPNVCIFYGRDRKETDVNPREYKNFTEYTNNADFQEYDYLYIEKKKKWHLYNNEKNTLKSLHNAVLAIHKKYGLYDNEMFEQYLNKLEIAKNYKKLDKSLIANASKQKYKI